MPNTWNYLEKEDYIPKKVSQDWDRPSNLFFFIKKKTVLASKDKKENY